MTDDVLDVDNLHVRYGAKEVLEGVFLRLSAVESVAVMGRTGSGKSTLLSCIAGLQRPSSGKVVVAGKDVTGMRARALAAHRRSALGVVFQHGELLPALTSVENTALPAMLQGVAWPEARDRATRLLESLGVPTDDTPASVLSGGERQRTALARALVNSPRLVVADESTGALDTETRDEVLDLVVSRAREEGCGLLLVTHDPAVAARADRVFRLEAGRLQELAREGAR